MGLLGWLVSCQPVSCLSRVFVWRSWYGGEFLPEILVNSRTVRLASRTGLVGLLQFSNTLYSYESLRHLEEIPTLVIGLIKGRQVNIKADIYPCRQCNSKPVDLRSGSLRQKPLRQCTNYDLPRCHLMGKFPSVKRRSNNMCILYETRTGLKCDWILRRRSLTCSCITTV
jgi:hypothetical protein